MKTWHNRLQEAMTARGKEWSDLFHYLTTMTGIKKPSVYAWKVDIDKRSTMMNADNAALVCQWLHINPMWLFHNKGPSGLDQGSDVVAKIADIVATLPPDSQARLLHYLEMAVAMGDVKAQQQPLVTHKTA